MALIEFQVSAAAFLAAQRTALRARQICAPGPMSVGNVDILIDRIEFGGNTIRHDVLTDFPIFYEDSRTSTTPGHEVEGYQTQIAQDVTIYVTTQNDILSRPNQSPAISVPLKGALVFNLDFYTDEDECYLGINFKHLEPGPLPFLPPTWTVNVDALVAAAETLLQPLVAQKAIPAGLSDLTAFWTKFVNAGVSVNPSLQRITFRAQIGPYPGVGLWPYFLKGTFPERIGAADWAFYIDSGLITEKIKAEVNRVFDEEVDIDHLQTFVGCNYSNSNGKAAFTLDVLGIYDLPDPLGTVSRDPKLRMELSAIEPNTLRLLADYSDVIGLIHSFDILEFILPALSNGIEGILQVLIGSALADLSKGKGAPFCKQISFSVVECKKSIQLPQTSTSLLSLTNLLALDDGIAFVGSMKSADLTPVVISTRVREFTWQPPKVSCSSASLAQVALFQQSPSGFILLHAQAIIDKEGTTPIYLCSFSVVNDTLGAFPIAGIRVDAGPSGITLQVNIPIPPASYYQTGNLYPCDLLVRTTAGTRLLRIAPPPLVTQAELDKIVTQLLVKVGDCEQQVDPWFNHHTGYNPAWSVDPPFDARVVHLWEFEVTGLLTGDKAFLVGSANQELVRATAQAGAPLRLSALLTPAGANELTLMRGSGPSDALTSTGSSDTRSSTDDARGIQVGQHLLLRLGSISLNDECQSIQLATALAGRCLLAVLSGGIKAYDFGNPTWPTLVRSWAIPGVRGALTWRGSLLCFGDEGFDWIDDQAGRTADAAECCDNPILAAAGAGQALYAVTAEGLEIYTSSLCKAGVIACQGARSLVRMGRRLVVGGREGLTLYDIEDPLHPCPGTSLGELDVTALMRPMGTGAETVLATLADGSARLLRVTGDEIVEVAVYDETPWFADSIRLDELLVRIGEDGQSLDISRFWQSAAI